MSKYKDSMTAGELMKQLTSDPAYLQMRAGKDEKRRLLEKELDAINRPILDRLELAGFPANSFQELIKKFAPLPESAVSILMDVLKHCAEMRVQESLIRALGAANQPFDGRPLIECFNATQNESLRFAILNTIALTAPHSIEDWLNEAKENQYLREKLIDLGYKW